VKLFTLYQNINVDTIGLTVGLLNPATTATNVIASCDNAKGRALTSDIFYQISYFEFSGHVETCLLRYTSNR